MFRKILFTLFLLVGVLMTTACNSGQTATTPDQGIANPASVYCEENGGKVDLRTDASGGVSGICVFPDGSECEEWAFQRGECQPGTTVVPQPKINPQPTAPEETSAVDYDSYGWKIYRNPDYGYSFHYPADAQIVSGDDPLKSLTVLGPLVNGDNWPSITISHPSDREEFRPPEDVDLEQWLTDHNLLADERQPDMQIAGVPAVHTRHDRSPQSYAYDRYYFAKNGQLYMIVIGHTGDNEDWALYNRFLDSIQFSE